MCVCVCVCVCKPLPLPAEGPLPARLPGDSLRDLAHQIPTCRAGEGCQHCCGPHCGPFWHKPGSRGEGRRETGALSSVLLSLTCPVLPPSLALLPPELRVGSSGAGTTGEVPCGLRESERTKVRLQVIPVLPRCIHRRSWGIVL